jgi:hypothetical protein
MLASIEVRTPGMPEGLLQHLRATTSALKQICALLPVEPTAVLGTSAAQAVAPASGTSSSAPPVPAAAPSALQPSSPTVPGIGIGGQHLPPQQGAPAAHAGETAAQPSMEELQFKLRTAQERVQAQGLELASLRAAAATSTIGNAGTPGLQPSAPGIPSQFEVVAAAAAAAEAADLSRTSEATASAPPQPSTTGPAVAADTAPNQPPQLPPAPNASLPAVEEEACDLAPPSEDGTCQSNTQATPKDDDMGGGASNGMARKRAADALEAARGLAAKAKAKSKAQ